MDKSRILKRRMLRQAVRENVDVIEGRYRARKAGTGARAHNTARIFFFVAVPLALAVASFLFFRSASVWLALKSEEVQTDQLRGADPVHEVSSLEGLPDIEGPRAARLTEEQVAVLSNSPSVDTQAFPLDVRRVVIDPGHGGRTVGTEAPSGLVEKEIALDISRRLGESLEAEGYEVMLTREGDDFISLEDRVVFANSKRGDLFISIHLNWIDTRDVRGVETYFLGPTNDPYLTQLAAAENRDSGYSMADFRDMLDQVYAGVRQTESEHLASAVQRSLYNSLRRVNPQLQNRGVKKAPFVVLMGTSMPAILAEVSCLSNEKEATLLKTPDYRQFIAEALFEGIDSYARQVRGSDNTGS